MLHVAFSGHENYFISYAIACILGGRLALNFNQVNTARLGNVKMQSG